MLWLCTIIKLMRAEQRFDPLASQGLGKVCVSVVFRPIDTPLDICAGCVSSIQCRLYNMVADNYFGGRVTGVRGKQRKSVCQFVFMYNACLAAYVCVALWWHAADVPPGNVQQEGPIRLQDQRPAQGVHQLPQCSAYHHNNDFPIHACTQGGQLTVQVHAGRNLVARDHSIFGKPSSDPYVKIKASHDIASVINSAYGVCRSTSLMLCTPR